jgi:hypothetical protein
MNASTLPIAHLSPCVRMFIESLIAEPDQAASESLFRTPKPRPVVSQFIELNKTHRCAQVHRTG